MSQAITLAAPNLAQAIARIADSVLMSSIDFPENLISSTAYRQSYVVLWVPIPKAIVGSNKWRYVPCPLGFEDTCSGI